MADTRVQCQQCGDWGLESEMYLLLYGMVNRTLCSDCRHAAEDNAEERLAERAWQLAILGV